MKHLALFFVALFAMFSCGGGSGEGKEDFPVSSVELNKNQLELFVGSSDKLVATVKPDNATDKTVKWKSSNANIVSVDNEGKVSAIKEGTSIVTAKAGNKTATCNITVKKDPGYVDIGLSVKWATRNLGASTPSEYGDYYAWGEIETKSRFSTDNYMWFNYRGSVSEYIIKYNSLSEFGPVDQKKVLDKDDDAAFKKLGGNWRMPTADEMIELYSTANSSNYKWEWVEINGHYGWNITYLVNLNTIFLPAAGYRIELALYKDNTEGYFWSSNVSVPVNKYDNPYQAECLSIDKTEVSIYGMYRYYGLPIRPIYKE